MKFAELLLVIIAFASAGLVTRRLIQLPKLGGKLDPKLLESAQWEVGQHSLPGVIVVTLEKYGEPPQDVAAIKLNDPKFSIQLLEARAEAQQKAIELNCE